MPNTYIINTNKSYDLNSEPDMLKNKKCAAYGEKWKKSIEQIKTNDIVFLYSNTRGIIARGMATGILKIADYEERNKPSIEYYMDLNGFQILRTPLPASRISYLVGVTRYDRTDIPLTHKNGIDLWEEITQKCL